MRLRAARRGWFLAALAVGAGLGLSQVVGAGLSLQETVRHAGHQVPAPLFTIDDVLRKPRLRKVALSPDGETVAYVVRETYGSSVWTFDPATGSSRRRCESKLVSGFAWSTDGSGLFLETSTRVAFLPLAGGRPAFVVRLDPDREQAYEGVDPTMPRQILISDKESDSDYRLLRIAVDGQSALVYRSRQPIRSFLLGDDGRVAFISRAVEFQVVVERLTERGAEELFRCEFLDACQLLSVIDGGRRLLLESRDRGDLLRLLTVDLESGSIGVLHEDPEAVADLERVFLDSGQRVPLFATYVTDRLRPYPLDSRLQAGFEQISRRLPASSLQIEATLEGRYWLIEETGPQLHHPRYHLYDTVSASLRPLLAAQREEGEPLAPGRLAPQRLVRYHAGDGKTIFGFLTLPSGIAAATAPLVVVAHGGPWTQAEPGFNGVGQLLANRGYLVFEPNFRGSTGYGFDYLMSARGEFGNGRVLKDIIDGVDFLLAQGVGDPDRVAIIGHSFGGYATLSALAIWPDRFRAGVASAPPIDLVRALRDLDETIVLGNGIRQRDIVEQLLADFDDPQAVDALRRSSPEHRLAQIARPLVIVAGGQDAKIDVVDIKHFAVELAGLGRDVSLLVDDQAGHGLRESRVRRAWFRLTEAFLAYHLGGGVGPPPGARLERYLEGNLLLTGESLVPALELASSE